MQVLYGSLCFSLQFLDTSSDPKSGGGSMGVKRSGVASADTRVSKRAALVVTFNIQNL